MIHFKKINFQSNKLKSESCAGFNFKSIDSLNRGTRKYSAMNYFFFKNGKLPKAFLEPKLYINCAYQCCLKMWRKTIHNNSLGIQSKMSRNGCGFDPFVFLLQKAFENLRKCGAKKFEASCNHNLGEQN